MATNVFQGFDIPLTNGLNTITLHAYDLAGNSTNLTVSFTFDPSEDTNPPAVDLYWPQNNDQLSGSIFTWRGHLDDFTAKITATFTDTNSNVKTIEGLVERDGNFWIKNLPLSSGTTLFTLTATDFAGNNFETNVAIVKSDVTVAIESINGSFWQCRISVSGSISASGYKVWVNGKMATNGNNGIWGATNVPVPIGGTGLIQARAIPDSDNFGEGAGGDGGSFASYTDPGNPTSSDSVTAQLEADKESRIMLMSDHFRYHMETYGENSSTFVDLDWPWARNEITHATSHTVEQNLGPNCDTKTTYTLPACGFDLSPYCDEGVSEWTTVCNGETGTGGRNDVQPIINMDRGFYWDAWGDPAWMYYTQDAISRTVLKTGGDGASRAKNLFVIAAGAIEYLNNERGTRPVAPPSITVGALGALNSNGILYAVLPDGQTIDATVLANGAGYYVYSVTQQKYAPGVSLTPSEGTLISGTNEPAVYRVCPCDGDVIVTATTSPSISTNDLPPCWSFTGGTEIDKLHHKIKKKDLLNGPVTFSVDFCGATNKTIVLKTDSTPSSRWSQMSPTNDCPCFGGLNSNLDSRADACGNNLVISCESHFLCNNYVFRYNTNNVVGTCIYEPAKNYFWYKMTEHGCRIAQSWHLTRQDPGTIVDRDSITYTNTTYTITITDFLNGTSSASTYDTDEWNERMGDPNP